MRSVSVSKKEGKLNPSRHGVVEVDDVVDCDESSESTGVRSRVSTRLVSPTPACSCLRHESFTGGRSGYRRGYFIEKFRHERDSGHTRA